MHIALAGSDYIMWGKNAHKHNYTERCKKFSSTYTEVFNIKVGMTPGYIHMHHPCIFWQLF